MTFEVGMFSDNKKLSEICDYPLHLGITEAGGLLTGSIKSSIGIGQLLMDGIGDTIRVSLSSDPVDEVKAGYEILKSLGIRSRGVNIISCPSCARQAFPVIETVKALEEKLSHIKEPITLSRVSNKRRCAICYETGHHQYMCKTIFTQFGRYPMAKNDIKSRNGIAKLLITSHPIGRAPLNIRDYSDTRTIDNEMQKKIKNTLIIFILMLHIIILKRWTILTY